MSGSPHAERSIEQKSTVGMAWLTGEAAAGALLQIAYTAGISRLLDPRSFGVLAASGLLIRLIGVISRTGIQNAVIQAKELSSSQVNSAFTFAALVGSISSAVLFVAAPLVQTITDHSEAVAVTRLVGLTALLGALGSVSEGIIRRRFDFRSLAWIGVASQAIGFSTGIVSALLGAGVWSLAFASVAQATSGSLLLLITAGHVFRPSLKLADGKRLIQFGVGSSIIGYLEFIGSSLDTISVGRWVGTFGLGQYSRATMLVQLPASQAAGVIGRVLLTSMSSIQTERARLIRVFESTIAVYAMALMCIAAAAAASAPALVRVILGDGWQEAAEVLPVVAVGSALTLGAQPTGTIAEAIGALTAKLSITVLQIVVGSAGIALAVISDAGLQGFAAAWVGGEAARWLAYLVFAHRVFGLTFLRLLRPYGEAAIVAACLSLPLSVATRIASLPALVALAVGSSAGGMLAAAAVWSLRSHLSAFAVAQAVLRSWRS